MSVNLTTWKQTFPRSELWPLGLVLVAAAGIRAVWWSLGLPPFLDPDSWGYFVPGYDLLTSGQLTVGLRRTPGYALFSAGVLGVFGRDSLMPLLGVQHLIGVVTAGLTYLLGRVLFGRMTALLAGLLVALDGALLLLEHNVMTEALSAFWLVAGCLLLVLGLRLDRTVLVFLAGLALGILTIIRPTGQVMLLPPLVGCLLVGRRRWLNAALLFVGFALLAAPWMARNWVEFRTPGLTGSGRFLVARALKYDDLFRLWAASGKATVGDPLDQAALAIVLEEDAKKEPDSVTQRFRRELGLDEIRADPVMRRLALSAISANPLHYLSTTAAMAHQTVVNRPLDVSAYWHNYSEVNWPGRLDFLLPNSRKDRFPIAQALASVFDPGRFGLLLGVLFLVGAVAACREPESRLWLAPAAMVTLGILATAAIGGMEWRYRFGFDPLLLLGASAGLAPIGAGARSLVRGRRRRVRLPALKQETA
jgi:4-amino-4-deoxy-L-arabinose transferase-like glycosyltransferase